MPLAYISVGSNIEPDKNIRKAIGLIAGRVKVTGISTVYYTEPAGRPHDPWYYNCVIEVETEIPPKELKQALRGIEDSLGRVRGADKCSPRAIDLDLILYGDEAVKDLSIPDPEIPKRPFLAIPLYELSPGLKLPGLGIAIKDIAQRTEGRWMKPLGAYTAELKRDILHEEDK